jgi:hypothetical protein
MCKQPNCAAIGTKHCSACQNVWYCSVECQRANWKEHKVTCGKELLSERELYEFLSYIMPALDSLDRNDREGRSIRYLKTALLYAEYQFGYQVPGEWFRRRKDGVVIKNDWPLFALRAKLTRCYINQNTVAFYEIALGFATETRAQLEMRRNNNVDRWKVFLAISAVNRLLGIIYTDTMRYEKALYHKQEALAAARCQYEINGETSNLLDALKSMAQISGILKTGEGAKYAEEAYNLVSGQHGPVHCEVQEAATCLIDRYLEMGNFVDAERFARITYECLIDPNNNVDRKSKTYAYGIGRVVDVWVRTPPDQRIGGPEAAEEAETLARESCDLFTDLLRGEDTDDGAILNISSSYAVLGKVMLLRGKRGSETERTLLKGFSLTKSCREGEVPRVESSRNRYNYLRLIGEYYFSVAYDELTFSYDNVKLDKAKDAFEECAKIATALFGSDDEQALYAVFKVGDIESVLYAVSQDKGDQLLSADEVEGDQLLSADEVEGDQLLSADEVEGDQLLSADKGEGDQLLSVIQDKGDQLLSADEVEGDQLLSADEGEGDQLLSADEGEGDQLLSVIQDKGDQLLSMNHEEGDLALPLPLPLSFGEVKEMVG